MVRKDSDFMGLGEGVYNALDKVLREEVSNTLIFTPLELIKIINSHLLEDEKIDIADFEKYLCGSKKRKVGSFYDTFMNILELQRLKAKRKLFDKLDESSSRSWQRHAWKIERLYDEWNKQKKDDATNVKKIIEREIHYVTERADRIVDEIQGKVGGSGKVKKG